MNPLLENMQAILQMLALPVSGQVHLDEQDLGRVERFRATFNASHGQLCRKVDYQLSRQQKEVLVHLAGLLFQMNPEPVWQTWSANTLRRHATWREVRRRAREALISFSWSLDLPKKALLQDKKRSPGVWETGEVGWENFNHKRALVTGITE